MHNVIYSKIVQHPAEEMGGEHAKLYLTNESNGYAIWLRVDHTAYLMAFFVLEQANLAVETAVKMALSGRAVAELIKDAIEKIYPSPFHES